MDTWELKKHHEDGNVPTFFVDFWTEKHDNESPFENEKEYKRIDEGRSKYYWWGLLFSVISLSLLGWALTRRDLHLDTGISIWVAMVTAIILAISSFVIHQISAPEKSGKVFHFEGYYYSLGVLFKVFHITPSPSIGKLSKEEFTKAIAGSLRTMANRVELMEGFERVSAMDDWRNRHEVALAWGLCEEKYDKYWPRKSAGQ